MNKYNRKIMDTHHSIAQFYQRYSDISEEAIEWVINNAIDKIVEEHDDASATYGIWSKSTGICVIFNWQRDKFVRNDTRNHALLITFPPLKDTFGDFHTTSKSDVRLIVESQLAKDIDKKYFKESLHSQYIVKISKNGLPMFLENGILFDSGITYCIEVE